MAFHDIRLSDQIERGSKGGPKFYTSAIISPSGHSQRNQNWEDDLPEWDISYGIQRDVHIRQVITHWYGRRGAAHSFPFRAWNDYMSGPANNLLPTFQGNGDGVVDNIGFAGHRAGTMDWQLVKTYGDSINPYLRQIYRPDLVVGVIYYVNDVVTAVTHLGDGVFRFANAVIPLVGQVITAKFQFDIPVHYTSDNLAQELAYVNVSSLPAITLVGVRPPNY